MAQSKYHNHYIPEPIVGEAYWKGGRIKVPPPRPKLEDIVKWRAVLVRKGLVSFQGKEDEE